ncbi:hypothetical protein NLG97_g2339 [Lecanicillium saksenae]|uniref:Uncharacterized protein n=1 Tax=Lecanicillium saksenae TaxID=468837 RepID=A0ACC1R149_9HYPO|nr:hypothetical protein NLG97_g2339 [Lecanicillium saksenae]
MKPLFGVDTFTSKIVQNLAFLDDYTLPYHVQHHVESIEVAGGGSGSPMSNESEEPHIQGQALKLSNAPLNTTHVDCFKYVTPECLRLLYNISQYTHSASVPNASFGIYQPAWETWLAPDLDSFFTQFQPELVSQRPFMLSIDGGYLQTDVKYTPFNLEANLDFQYAISLVHPLPVGDKYYMGNLNTMLAGFDKTYYCGTVNAPFVISISYTKAEAALPRDYVERQCLEFLKLGLQGTTVLVASGDRGAAANNGSWIDPSTGSLNSTKGFFSPNFPASCPWVTTVGGTQLESTDKTWEPNATSPKQTTFYQTFTDNVTVSSSGGGFSNVVKTPFYQMSHTQTYMDSSSASPHLANLSSAGYFNRQGRAYPDLSALSNNYLVSIYEKLHNVKGTSAPTPVIASMIALINAARQETGKGPVGFINPALYYFGDGAMSDIVDRHNEGCGVSPAYPATAGWDPATGLGTPDFTKLLKLFMELP